LKATTLGSEKSLGDYQAVAALWDLDIEEAAYTPPGKGRVCSIEF
jgi:hypothetical protein